MDGMQEQAAEALEFLRCAHEVVPPALQVALLALLGLGMLGGAAVLWRMFRRRRDRREREREEVRLARLVAAVDPELERQRERDRLQILYLLGHYETWDELMADARRVASQGDVDIILARCPHGAPPRPQPQTVEDEIDAELAARLEAERQRMSQAKTVKLPVTRVYLGGSNPCAPCQRIV